MNHSQNINSCISYFLLLCISVCLCVFSFSGRSFLINTFSETMQQIITETHESVNSLSPEARGLKPSAVVLLPPVRRSGFHQPLIKCFSWCGGASFLTCCQLLQISSSLLCCPSQQCLHRNDGLWRLLHLTLTSPVKLYSDKTRKSLFLSPLWFVSLWSTCRNEATGFYFLWRVQKKQLPVVRSVVLITTRPLNRTLLTCSRPVNQETDPIR